MARISKGLRLEPRHLFFFCCREAFRGPFDPSVKALLSAIARLLDLGADEARRIASEGKKQARRMASPLAEALTASTVQRIARKLAHTRGEPLPSELQLLNKIALSLDMGDEGTDTAARASDDAGKAAIDPPTRPSGIPVAGGGRIVAPPPIRKKAAFLLHLEEKGVCKIAAV